MQDDNFDTWHDPPPSLYPGMFQTSLALGPQARRYYLSSAYTQASRSVLLSQRVVVRAHSANGRNRGRNVTVRQSLERVALITEATHT